MNKRPALTIRPNKGEQPGTWTTDVDGEVKATVTTLVEAVETAQRHGYDLKVPPEAYNEMVAAGVAPKNPPAKYEDLLAE